MFRSPGKTMLMVAVLALAALPSLQAAAQFTNNLPTGPTLDAEVCSDTEIVLSFNPVYEQLGLDFTAYFFSIFGENVTISRMYPDAHICDPVGDPNGLTHIYRVQVQGSFVTYDAQFYRDYLHLILVQNYPICVAVEMDCQVSAQAVPDGMIDGWQLHNMDLDTSLIASWNPTIAVLDTGIDDNHPALQGNPILMADGYNYDNENDPANLTDFHGHGTAMAGVIANTAPGATILPFKVLYDDGVGHWGAVGRALLHAGFKAADVANLSLGAPIESPYFFNQAVTEVVSNSCYDMVVVAAAGNSCDTGTGCPDVFYPAMLPDVMSVVAHDTWGQFFKRTAGEEIDVDLSAPGVTVCTAWSQAADDVGTDPYRRLSGSSVAAAHVSAVAGLARYNKPNMDDAAIRAHLVDTGNPPYQMLPLCAGKPPLLSGCNALDLGGCANDKWDIVGHSTDLACEIYSGPGAQWDYDPWAATQTTSCPGFGTIDTHESQAVPAPALGFCPETGVPSLRCSARLNSQPNRTPCPDCDADIYETWGIALLTLRMRSFDMAYVDGLVVRITDDTGTYAYTLDHTTLSTGFASTTNYYVLYNGNHDFSDPTEVSAHLVTYFDFGNKRSFTIDPLNINVW